MLLFALARFVFVSFRSKVRTVVCLVACGGALCPCCQDDLRCGRIGSSLLWCSTSRIFPRVVGSLELNLYYTLYDVPHNNNNNNPRNRSKQQRKAQAAKQQVRLRHAEASFR